MHGDSRAAPPAAAPVHHILLISIDGMHQSDLAGLVAQNPNSSLAQLQAHGYTYSEAHTSMPSDSFPGMAGLMTGGSPKTTGVYYDDSFDRALAPAGSDCSKLGAAVVLDEAVDRDPTLADGGGIDANKLPRDPQQHCAPLYPHQFLRVNTVFEVVQQGGGHTAWSDKHPAYEFLQGPSGHGVDDLYAPEIAAIGTDPLAVAAYDDDRVAAVINEIAGKDHRGHAAAAVPVLFGMNFQGVSVAQKAVAGGYLKGTSTPGPVLAAAMAHADESLGKLVAALKDHGLYEETVVVVTAKHGQSPIDPAQLHPVSQKALLNAIGEPLAHATLDDIAMLWLADSSKADVVAARLQAKADALGIDHIFQGNERNDQFGDPATDSRAPDLVVKVKAGVIYMDGAKKISEHGGLGDDDRHVPLVVAHPAWGMQAVATPVMTQQLAPTMLELLKLPPQGLMAVKAEGTASLPGLNQ